MKFGLNASWLEFHHLLQWVILFAVHMHLPNMLLETVKRRMQLPRIVYLSFLIHITQIKQKQKLYWQRFLRALTSQTHIHGALQGRIKVQQVGILISRKQQSECGPSQRWAAVCGQQQHSSPLLLFQQFVQPCWHMFHNLSQFCFNLPDTLKMWTSSPLGFINPAGVFWCLLQPSLPHSLLAYPLPCPSVCTIYCSIRPVIALKHRARQ